MQETDPLKKNLDFFASLILAKEDPIDIYRLLCLVTQVDGGFKSEKYEEIVSSMVETYGFSQVRVIKQLAKAGLFYKKGTQKSKCAFSAFQKTEKLIDLTTDTHDAKLRKYYSYGAYTPITVRILEHAFKECWLTGQFVDMIPGKMAFDGDPRFAASSQQIKRVVLVYMVGGLTLSEIGLMRNLARLYNIELVIASTNILNYKRMLTPFTQSD